MFCRIVRILTGQSASKPADSGNDGYRRPETYDDVVLELVNASAALVATYSEPVRLGLVVVDSDALERLRKAIVPFTSHI